MPDIIQQLLDLKEWSQNPERYERRLAFREQHFPPSPEAGTIPIEFDELSPQEQQYYQQPPFSTDEVFLGSKGGVSQLVQPRQGFYKKGFVKQQPKAEDLEMAKKFYKKPFHKLTSSQKWGIINKATTGHKKLGGVRRQKIIEFLKDKKQIHSLELREFLAKLPGSYEGQRPSELRGKKWFQDLNIKYIQDPNPMLTGEKRGGANIPKARKTVYNKYAELLHKNQPKTYLSSNWDELSYRQRQDIASIAHNNDYKFRVKYSVKLRFNPTKEKKLMDVFGLTEQNFLDHGKYGVEKTVASGKRNPTYTKIYNYTQNDFKFPKKDLLDISTQRKIMNTFELPADIAEWNFKEYRYGVPYTGDKHMNLGKRISNSLRESPSWRLATDWSKPKGWMMHSMYRAFQNDMRLPNGQLAYEPKYETIDGKKRIIGFTDHTTAGGGKTYYGLKKWDKIHKGAEWASHGDFKKTSKFVDITKRAYAPPNEIIKGLLEKGGMPRDGNLQLNHVLKFLAQQEGYDVERIKNAIVKHHMGGVGARKMLGSPTNDLQILRSTVNNAIKKIENKIRKGIYLKDDITALKNYGASVRGLDGRLYGAGSRTAIGGFKAIEKYAEEKIGKWESKDFKKFKTYIKQLGCGLYSGGRVDFAKAGTVKTKNIATKGDAAVMKKIVEVGAKKGAARTALMWLGPLGLGGDVLFEAGDIAVQMLGGKPLDEALRNNWLTGMFTEGTEKELRDIRVFKDTGPGAKTYVQGSEAYEKLQKMYKALAMMKQKQVGSRLIGKEITDADIKKMEEDVAAQERYTIMLDKKESAFRGGAGEEEYRKASEELEDKRGATSWATEQKLKYREDQPTSDRYKPMNIDISLPPAIPQEKQFDTVDKMAEFFIDDDMWNYYKDYGWKDKTELFTEARKQDPEFNKKVWHNVMNYGDVGIKGTQDSFFGGTYDKAPTGHHFAEGGIVSLLKKK